MYSNSEKSGDVKQALIKRNIEKSDCSLRSAEIMIRENLLAVALSNTYYAVYYTIIALAEKHDFKTSKHNGLLNWFNKKFVQEEKIFTKEMYKVYQEAFEYKQKGDYDTLYAPVLDITTDLLEKSKVFIKTVREYLDNIA